MTEKSPRDSSADEESMGALLKRKRRALCLGAVLSLGIVVLGGWLFRSWSAPPPAAPTPPPKLMGVVDLQKAIQAHKDYGSLRKLREEHAALREEIKELLPPPRVDPPEVEAKPFEDSARQKFALDILGQRAELDRQRRKIAAEYREQTENEYIARRDAIDGEYVNAMANLRMKLDNADVLKLDQEMVEEIAAQLERLQRERGEQQEILWEQREKEILEYSLQATSQRMGEILAQAETMKSQMEAEAVRRQTEAQARDIQRMEQQMEDARRFQSALQKKQEMMEKEQEILSLEKHMFNDVAGKAAKVAILHHYTMIIANPAIRLDALLPLDHRADPVPERYASVIVSNAEDLTEELMKELEN